MISCAWVKAVVQASKHNAATTRLNHGYGVLLETCSVVFTPNIRFIIIAKKVQFFSPVTASAFCERNGRFSS